MTDLHRPLRSLQPGNRRCRAARGGLEPYSRRLRRDGGAAPASLGADRAAGPGA